MKMNILKASAIALLAVAPGAVLADSIAASLSASFGRGGFVMGGVGGAGGAGSAMGATSVSVAGAAGDWAAAGSVANRNSSAAVAGASNSIAAVPAIRVEAGRRGIYETSVVFEAPATDARLAAMAADIAAISNQLSAICSAVHEVSDFTGGSYAVALTSELQELVSKQVREVGTAWGWLNPDNYDSFVLQYGLDVETEELVVSGQTVTLNCPA